MVNSFSDRLVNDAAVRFVELVKKETETLPPKMNRHFFTNLLK